MPRTPKNDCLRTVGIHQEGSMLSASARHFGVQCSTVRMWYRWFQDTGALLNCQDIVVHESQLLGRNITSLCHTYGTNCCLLLSLLATCLVCAESVMIPWEDSRLRARCPVVRPTLLPRHRTTYLQWLRQHQSTYTSILINGDMCYSLTNQNFSCPELMAINLCTVDVESAMQTTVL